MVQVDKFKVSTDFTMLEIKGAPLRHKKYMILLGRLFMATTKTVLDVHSGKLTMTVLGETVQIKVIDSMSYSFVNFLYQCSYVEYIYLPMSNLSSHGKNGADLEAAHFKAKWKRRRRKQWKRKG